MAVPLLVAPPIDDPLLPFTLHLGAVTVFVLALTFHLAPLGDGVWLAGSSLSGRGRGAFAGVWLVALVAGATGLVTVATAAGLRFAPSLQFLALLSALDIAWVVSAVGIGARRRWGGRVGGAAAAVAGVVCAWSMWRYLDTVGFADDGGWVVDGGEIARLVLPFDAIAAIVAVVVFSLGIRALPDDQATGRTAQPSDQS